MTQLPIYTVQAYLDHLQAGDTAALISTFEDDGVVHSPFLGTMPAGEFFKKLAQASSKSVITLIDLFQSVQASSVVRVAAYFRYDWTLTDGTIVDFTCVDVFNFRPGSSRIHEMQIVLTLTRCARRWATSTPRIAEKHRRALVQCFTLCGT